MIVELKKGYTIESRYDKFSDSYITRLLDNESKQVGDALSSKDIVGKNQDIKSVRDYFTNYINNKRVEEEIPDEIDYIEPEEEFEEEEDIFEESLNLEDFDSIVKQKARKTKKATRKAKLPALSKMSPIMPDYAKGIDAFNSMQADGNSSMGSTTGSISLGEEFEDRNSLIKELQNMGFNYKFDKYSDKQLFRIYQERLAKLKKLKAQKEKEQKEADLRDQKIENSKDSYFRDGIEFESEEAAKDYFGESMDNKFYLNDMHKAWDMMDPEDEVSIPTTHSNLNESFSGKNTKQFNTITEGLKFFENKCFDETCEDIQLESLFESMRDKLSSDDIKKLGAFMNHAEDADEVVTYMKGLLSEDLDSDKLSTQDLYALANECINVATSNNVWNVDIADVENFGGVAVITFLIKGDWKHDHARFDLIAREFFGENIKFPFDVYEYDADENGDYDSDYYPAYHAVEIQLEESNDEPITLELKESANNSIHITYRKSGYGGFTRDGMDIDLDSYKSKFEDIQGDENAKFAAILLKSSISRSVYSAIVFSNDEDEIKSIAKDWLYKNELSSDQLIEIHYYAMVIDIEAGKEIACGDTWADSESIRKGWKEFSLNESLKEDWSWPEENGYVNDAHERIAFILDELAKIGFKHDKKYPIRDDLFGRKHIQIINPDLITSEETFEEDIKPLVDVLNNIEETFGETARMTYNIGANDDLQVTAGIDVGVK